VSVATSRIANNLAQMLALLPVVLLTKDVRSRTPAPTCRISDTCLQVLHLQHVPLSPGRPGAPRSPRSQRGAIDNPTRPTNGRQRGCKTAGLGPAAAGGGRRPVTVAGVRFGTPAAAEPEELEAVERERAEKVRRQKISASRSGETVETLPPSQKTRDKVAAAVGLGSGRTYDKAAKVFKTEHLPLHRGG